MPFKRITARPDHTRLPSLPLPIYVRSAGAYRLEPSYESFHTTEGFVQVLWGVEGSGDMEIAGHALELSPGDVLWKLSGETHAYKPRAEEWELRWFTFDGPLADDFMRGYGYPRRLAGAGPCPVELFEEIETDLREMSPYGQRRLLSTATAILALAGRKLGAKPEANRAVDRFIALAQKRFENPETNVNSLAEELGIHRATLTRHFSELMRISPGEYLARLRVQRASSLLREASLPALEIGALVGVPDKSHFTRLFKSKTGLSPGVYRERMAKE